MKMKFLDEANDIIFLDVKNVIFILIINKELPFKFRFFISFLILIFNSTNWKNIFKIIIIT